MAKGTRGKTPAKAKKPAAKKSAGKTAAKKPGAKAKKPAAKLAAAAKPAKKLAPAKPAAKKAAVKPPAKKPALKSKATSPKKTAAPKRKPTAKSDERVKPRALRALQPTRDPDDEPDPLPEPPAGPSAPPAPEPEPSPAGDAVATGATGATGDRHPLTGAPLLPRERTADPIKRPQGARPAPVVVPAAAPSPASDPTWGALPQPRREERGDFSAFWSQDPPPSTPPTVVARPLTVPSSPVAAPGSSPSQHRPGGPFPSGGAPQPGAPSAPGEGRRRRRRRRRRGGGGRAFGPDGQPIQGGPPGQGQPGAPQNGGQRQPQPPVDPIFRRLRRQFNLRDFRPGQEQVIRDLLAGRDVLAIMPTGAGKSLTYQLTAFELPGVTVVVSPLLALMSDQLIKLRRTGAVAARLDSTETVKEKRATLERIEEGRHKIIYCTPERAASGALLQELGGQKVSLFVVDEAHCVSEWGHDFRPAYLSLKQFIQALAAFDGGRRPPVLALTATATPQVADDIIAQLELQNPDRVHTGFNRPSLSFDVRCVDDLKKQVRRLLRLIRRIKGPGIVYCSTVRDVEALAGALPVLGLKVGMYHGKMTKSERDESQKAFMRNNPRIMIATNAFGLGVDKPDIRFVIHYNVPGSIEQYYQEAGRAGRDGRASRCILLYNPNDEAVQEFFVGDKYPGKSEFKRVAFALAQAEANLKEVALSAETSQAKARVVLNSLRDQGFVQEEGPLYTLVREPDELTIGRAAEEYRKRREADRGKLEAMIRYARSTRCRVKILLEYFGETEVPLCRRCDNCVKYGEEAVKEKTEDLMSPIEVEEMEDEREPLPEIPEPPPPRKDPTHMF